MQEVLVGERKRWKNLYRQKGTVKQHLAQEES